MDHEDAWLRHVVAELVAHVADCLTPLLAPGLQLVAVGPQLVLTRTGVVRAVATHTVAQPRADPADLTALAHAVLADAQDLVTTHLHEPWPLTPSGRPVHPDTRDGATGVHLAYAAAADDERIELPAFTLPYRPPRTRPAG
ncbi:MAG: hypothetical protein ACT4RN_09815 [Pseudonocardia sp.]